MACDVELYGTYYLLPVRQLRTVVGLTHEQNVTYMADTDGAALGCRGRFKSDGKLTNTTKWPPEAIIEYVKWSDESGGSDRFEVPTICLLSQPTSVV